MLPAQLAALLLPLLPAMPHPQPTPDPELSIEYLASDILFHVDGPTMPFVGGVLLSLDSAMCHYFQGLPPLLCNYAVLGIGVAEGRLTIATPEHRLPPGIFISAQGVIADEMAIQATPVVQFVLDGSLPIVGDVGPAGG